MEMLELQRLKNKFDIIGNDAGLNRALNAARRMVNQFAPKSDTSILLLTDQTDLTDRSVDPRVTERAAERMEGLRADGAKLYE